MIRWAQERVFRRQNTQYSLHASISPNSSFEPVEPDDVVEKEVDGLVARVDPDRGDAVEYMMGYSCGFKTRKQSIVIVIVYKKELE